MFDCHTHRPENIGPDALFNCPPADIARLAAEHPGALFSTGIHPWDTALFESVPEQEQALNAPLDHALDILSQAAAHPQVAAIGETGLDRLRGASLPLQERVFKAHIALSEQLCKPLVLHVVKCFNEVLEIRKQLVSGLTQPWIFHGFRGKPQLARTILGTATETSPVFISLGQHFNSETARIIPAQSLLAETDESPLPIAAIISRIVAARGGQAISDRTLSPR